MRPAVFSPSSKAALTPSSAVRAASYARRPVSVSGAAQTGAAASGP